ncbi:hypothetical protein A4X09_0g1526 [Tilletia walkeri]|uniref:Transcription initiation factor TFIID subunit 1 histone acetyltransferase domain-containing protein n=1 Tax=Tilletia walkeri TaxID=117179 RepID=A0A8X7T6K3_9BASI|nr:hypothetical protein A4X09_0g1526 [Tilletia walkeri]
MEDGAVNAVSELQSLALGNVLVELGIDDGSNTTGLRQVGLASNRNDGASLDRDQIYNDKYADDDEGGARYGRADGNDYEREVDEELEQDAAAGRGAGLDRYFRKGLESLQSSRAQVRGEVGYDDDDDDDDEEETPSRAPVGSARSAAGVPATATSSQKEKVQAQPEPIVKNVQTLWPKFEKGAVLNFTDLFFEPPLKRRKTTAPKPKFRIVPESSLPYPVSTRELAHQGIWQGTGRQHLVRSLVANSFPPDVFEDEWTDEEDDTALNQGPSMKAIELDDWEDAIQWDSQATPGMYAQPVQPSLQKPLNHDIESGNWAKSILWDVDVPAKEMRIMLDMNDPDLILQEHFPENDMAGPPARTAAAPVVSHRAGRAPVELDPFNLSNDRFYEVSREQRQRVRQTLGQLEVQHAWPAVKLQFPFYKTRLSKGEARSFHRPGMQFPLNIPIKFSKVRSAKKKKDATKGRTAAGRNKEKDVWETLKKARDLTLKDTSNFVLYEYSEEYPSIISNFGMGSLLVNYYRKKNAKDEHIPKAELGVPFILDVTDESPFMKFGHIKPGQTQPTMYNNLIRAPLFKHKPAHTDFLLVRSTNKKEVKYVLREIKHLYTVGQIFPVVLIPGPHARLVSNVIKWRMQMIAFKLVQADPLERLKIAQIMRYFPDQNELQMRQRLKDIMEYNRRAGDPNQGFWKLKSGVTIPSDLDMYKPLPPEHLCLCEAMQAGQRYLLDLGYTKSAEGADDDAADESKMDIEQLLAPWFTTKNFLNAAQNKAMLKLHGDGDPSGRGEAFSFLRVSMKEVFVRAGEVQPAEPVLKKGGQRYNVAEQQAIYRSEIERIWNAQRKALSNPVPPTVSAEDIRRLQMETKLAQPRPSTSRNEVATPSASARATPDLDGGSQAGGDANKVLKIRRLINGKWKTEIVRDPNVWHAYVRQRQKIEDENTATEALVPTGDEQIDANRRKRLEEELASRIRNQERRLQRKNITLAGVLPGRGEAKVRKCGKCGQMGHMSTNTACPMHPKHQKNRAQAESTPASAPGTPLSATAPSMWPTSGPPSASFFPPTMPSPLGSVPPTPMYAPYAGSSGAGGVVPGTPGLPPGTPGLRMPMPPTPGMGGFPGMQRMAPGAMSPPPIPLGSGSGVAGPSQASAAAAAAVPMASTSAPTKLKLKINRPRPSDA